MEAIRRARRGEASDGERGASFGLCWVKRRPPAGRGAEPELTSADTFAIPAERSALRLGRRNRSGTGRPANVQLSDYGLSSPNRRKRNKRVRLQGRLSGRPSVRACFAIGRSSSKSTREALPGVRPAVVGCPDMTRPPARRRLRDRATHTPTASSARDEARSPAGAGRSWRQSSRDLPWGRRTSRGCATDCSSTATRPRTS